MISSDAYSEYIILLNLYQFCLRAPQFNTDLSLYELSLKEHAKRALILSTVKHEMSQSVY